MKKYQYDFDAKKKVSGKEIYVFFSEKKTHEYLMKYSLWVK